LVRDHQGGEPGREGRFSPPRVATSGAPDGQSGRGRPTRTELDARQIRAIAFYLEDPNKARVAEKIGVAPKTVSRWFQEPMFVAEYRRQLGDAQVELWTRLIATKDLAWERLILLMTRSEPAVSLRATTWLLNHVLSSTMSLDRSAAQQTGITADLEGRELELLELAGVVLRGGAAPVESSGDGLGDGATDDPAGPDREGADDSGR
jgi:hypothetical protein